MVKHGFSFFQFARNTCVITERNGEDRECTDLLIDRECTDFEKSFSLFISHRRMT